MDQKPKFSLEPESQSASPVVSLTMDQIREIVSEFRKPDPETAEKAAAERARVKERQEQMLRVATEEIEGKNRLQEMCDHKKENGRPAIGGQIHSDGLVHPLCLHCFKEFPPYKPGQEMIAGGI